MTIKQTIIKTIQQINSMTNAIINISTPIVNVITASTTCIIQCSEALINCFRTVGNIQDEDILEAIVIEADESDNSNVEDSDTGAEHDFFPKDSNERFIEISLEKAESEDDEAAVLGSDDYSSSDEASL